jgi:hypothetical protein
MALEHLGGTMWRLSFASPGDDGRCGTPAGYELRMDGRRLDVPMGTPARGGAAVSRDIRLPMRSGTLMLLARDEAGNPGVGSKRAFARPVPGSGGGGGDHAQDGQNGGGGQTGGGGGAGATAGRSAPGSSPPACDERATARVRPTRRVVVLSGRNPCAGAVRVAVQRNLGHGRCRSLRADGTFRRPMSCTRKVFLRARGGSEWRIRIAGRFRPGRYTAWVRFPSTRNPVRFMVD